MRLSDPAERDRGLPSDEHGHFSVSLIDLKSTSAELASFSRFIPKLPRNQPVVLLLSSRSTVAGLRVTVFPPSSKSAEGKVNDSIRAEPPTPVTRWRPTSPSFSKFGNCRAKEG